MSICVKIELGPRSYPLRLGPGLLETLGPACRAVELDGACLLVTDSNVGPLYESITVDSLRGAGFEVTKTRIAAGEASKSLEVLGKLYETAAAARLDRHATVIALGGGVVGDLAGFLAASYLRGLRFVQVPTSLLAMVDSSVGGKTGINLAAGKNLVGAFHQPVLVQADLGALRSLPQRELRAGLAEVIKYGVILDPKLFADLEKSGNRLLDVTLPEWETWIGRCCTLKANVVAADEREDNLRAILNYGHTLGHALEKLGGFRQYLHGEAIALGMVYAGELSRRQLSFPTAEAARIRALLNHIGLPTTRPKWSWADIRSVLKADKKALGGTPRWVLAQQLGVVRIGCQAAEEEMAAAYAAWPTT